MNISKIGRQIVSTFLTLITCMTAAFAADVPAHFQGTWVGTIGKAKVRFCLATNDKQSSYYYEKYQKKIPLWVDTAQPLQIMELDPAGSSDIRSDNSKVTAKILLSESGGSLIGKWSNDKRAGAVKLKRLIASPRNKVSNLGRAQSEADWFGCELIFYEPLIKTFKETKRESARASNPEDEESENLVLLLTTDYEGESNFYDPKYEKFISEWIDPSVISRYEISTDSNNDYWFRTSLEVVGSSENYLILQESFDAFYPGNAHPTFARSSSIFDKHTYEATRLDPDEIFDKPSIRLINAHLLKEIAEYLPDAADTEAFGRTGYPNIVSFSKEGVTFSFQGGGGTYMSEKMWSDAISITMTWSEVGSYLSPLGLEVKKDFTN